MNVRLICRGLYVTCFYGVTDTDTKILPVSTFHTSDDDRFATRIQNVDNFSFFALTLGTYVTYFLCNIKTSNSRLYWWNNNNPISTVTGIGFVNTN